MATKNNFSHVTNTEYEGVECAFITVDFINSMASETGDVTSGSSTAGLELVRNTFGQNGLQILGEGSLETSNTTKTYYVRADMLDTLTSSTKTKDQLQAAIRALNGGDNISADVSTATVNIMNLSDTLKGIS